VVLGTFATLVGAQGAEKLVATVPLADFDVGATPVDFVVPFAAPGTVNGIGLTTDWTAVVADQVDGVAPWSLDLIVTVTGPGASRASFAWNPVGGDVTIADFPLQDAVNAFPGGEPGTGSYTWEFSSVVPAPYVHGLRNTELHLTTTVPDVVFCYGGTTETGPMWDRPFFIAGISALGPVVYKAISFEVTESGLYTFESLVSSGNNYTFLYEGSFDPNDQLTNLLDYGLGNGFAPNGTPQGTSLVEVLLHTGVTYHFVNSQWASSPAGVPFTNVITGPGTLTNISPNVCPGDITLDGDTTLNDFTVLAANFGTFTGAIRTDGDLNADGAVTLEDFTKLAADFGCTALES
jgi:hypothetical protein